MLPPSRRSVINFTAVSHSLKAVFAFDLAHHPLNFFIAFGVRDHLAVELDARRDNVNVVVFIPVLDDKERAALEFQTLDYSLGDLLPRLKIDRVARRFAC